MSHLKRTLNGYGYYREHSGLENADRNHDALLQLVKNNAGIPVQKALSNGVDPAENTFRAIVDWGSRIENRWRLKPRSVASAQWLTEGNSTDNLAKGLQIKWYAIIAERLTM